MTPRFKRKSVKRRNGKRKSVRRRGSLKRHYFRGGAVVVVNTTDDLKYPNTNYQIYSIVNGQKDTLLDYGEINELHSNENGDMDKNKDYLVGKYANNKEYVFEAN